MKKSFILVFLIGLVMSFMSCVGSNSNEKDSNLQDSVATDSITTEKNINPQDSVATDSVITTIDAGI